MANKESLINLEKSLDIILLGAEVLKKGIGFYVYYNKPNENRRDFVIHKSSCGQCAWGTGKIPGSQPGKNGVWIGPFSNINQATAFINENFNPPLLQVVICDTCNN